MSRSSAVFGAVLFIVVAVAPLVVALLVRQPSRTTAAASATLIVTSVPSDVGVTVDGKERGRTPAQIAVTPGDRLLTFQDSRVIPTTIQARAVADQTTHVEARPWLRTPAVAQIRPPFPGASIADATFLTGGRVALVVTLPPGNDHQLWVRAPDGNLQRVTSDSAGAIALSPNGRQVATVLSPWASGDVKSPTPTSIRIATSDGQQEHQLPDVGASVGEQATDLSWSPDERHLLLVVQHAETAGDRRTQLRWLDVVTGSERTLVELPSTIVPASFVWSPDGSRVAFLTQSHALVSLCVLGIMPPAFRYLGDLEQNDLNPLPFAPLAWSDDGNRLVYAAPVQTQPSNLGGLLFGTPARSGLFTSTVRSATSHRLGSAEGRAPVWRPDGSILALTTASHSGSLAVESIDPVTGAAKVVGTVPIPPAFSFAVRWDAVHGQALLVQRDANGSRAFWLLSFTPEGTQ